ncbi:MAG: DUF2088 domain-containing protein, partial [Verrucomicrobia bacterium]|nr:DUF2088 domain-containing protein [Verrucomicrobiota bacterium]
GSRGITGLRTIVAAVVEALRGAGAQPYLVPAMGSHGGATAEGQVAILAEYGITKAALHVPIRAGMEVERVGKTPEGAEVYFSAEALRADGILIVNRVKPHTDFSGGIGSGILKMTVVGLGKRVGAANYHAWAARVGYEQMLRSLARVIVGRAPILGGIAMVENQRHDTARIAGLTRDELEPREEALFAEASRLMPRLPFEEIDLLVVDRLGKNISGAGMDPNIIGRGVHGSALRGQSQVSPTVRRIFVRDLTPETHGNAIGIGMADMTTTRLVRAMNPEITYVNALTSLALHSVKIPMHCATDREAITRSLASLALPDARQARVVRIADTLSLEQFEASEPCLGIRQDKGTLTVTGPPEEMRFDGGDNLVPLR